MELLSQVINNHRALLLTSCVCLGKLLNHSVPPFQLKNGNDNTTYTAGLL